MRQFLLFAAYCIAMNVPCAAFGIEIGSHPPLEVTGIVIERGSGKPLEGVWVLVPYHEVRTDHILISKQDCVRTRGMMTGPDGKFHFPIEKGGVAGPLNVSGIAPGYYTYTVQLPSQDIVKSRDPKAYSNWTVLMEKQDPTHPKYVTNLDAFCHWAKHPQDTEAADVYLEVELQEAKKYGSSPEHIEMLQRVISAHRSLGVAK
jgi:hypothetical protein